MRRLDYKRQLIDYFKRNINSKKYDADTLKFALYNQGYSRVAVDAAYNSAIKEMAEVAPILKEKPVIKHEIYDINDKPIQIEPMTKWEKFKNRLKGNKI
jgi:hypothetical protein